MVALPHRFARKRLNFTKGVFGKRDIGSTVYAARRIGFATVITSISIQSNMDWLPNRVTGHGQAFTVIFNSAGSIRIGRAVQRLTCRTLPVNNKADVGQSPTYLTGSPKRRVGRSPIFAANPTS